MVMGYTADWRCTTVSERRPFSYFKWSIYCHFWWPLLCREKCGLCLFKWYLHTWCQCE